MNSTPFGPGTSSRRWGTPLKARIPSATASGGRPAARAAAAAAATFSALWRPRTLSSSALTKGLARRRGGQLAEQGAVDHGGILRTLLGEDPQLGLLVGGKGAVPVEVVGGDVEEDRNLG